MGTVIQIAARAAGQAEDPLTALAVAVSTARQPAEDVFWLKENAEFLGALVATGTSLRPEALALYRPFYDGLSAKLQFFPQYYRFLLSLALDLETLGMVGETAAHLCHWVAARDLAGAELSDLQRAEAAMLLARRGLISAGADALESRLRAFAARCDVFALPNKKAAYELTHIVFYLSHHGQRDPQASPAVIRSLHHAGLVAWLDQDCDLLAEICIALHYARDRPPPLWVDWLANLAAQARLANQPQAQDSYHAWLMTRWALALTAGQPLAPRIVPHGGPISMVIPQTRGVLRKISAELLGLGPLRCPDWGRMRPMLCRALRAEDQAILTLAEATPIAFEDFFAAFARAGAGPG